MAIRMEDVPGYEPAPANYREAEVGFNIGGPGGTPFQGSPQKAMNTMAFVNRMNEMGSAPQEEEAPGQDISSVDPDKFRTIIHNRIGGDPRKFNIMNEARKLFASRIAGLRGHVFGAGARHLSTEQQSFFADEAAKLWRVCMIESGNERKWLQDEENREMDELARRKEAHKLKEKTAQEERKRGVDLTKIFTPESVKRFQQTGDIASLKKPKETISMKDRLEARTQINEETADRMANLEQNEDGNTLLNGKVATPAQLKTYERAIREQISREIYGPDLADVTGGKPGKTDYASIFGERKDTKDTGVKVEGARADGTKKGPGYFGELKRPDGKISTELSIGVEIDGKETEIPTLIPTLAKEEMEHLLSGKEPTDEIVKKAVDFAKKRIAKGKSPFALKGEQIKKSDLKSSMKESEKQKNMTVGDAIGALADEIKHESGVKKASRFTNSLSKRWGNTQLANEEFIKDMKAAAKEAGIAANFFNDWLKTMWFSAGVATEHTIKSILDLPVPGTEKKG